MKRPDDIEDPRRDFLVKALAAGLFVVGQSGIIKPAVAGILGRVPRRMPEGKSIFDLSGKVTVNGQLANLGTIIGTNDVVETGPNSRIIFVVGKDAFTLRSNSKLELSGGDTAVNLLRLLTGKLLSVFGETKHEMNTVTATIGIRGTGLYVESDPEQTYACTCYGTTDISSTSNPANSETIVSEHHNAPRYILANGDIRPAPFKDHTDDELMLIEELVGRTPPFSFIGGEYESPRRRDY